MKTVENASLFTDDKNREQVEHNYGFSGQNIEEYSAAIENKLESLAKIDEQERERKERKAAAEEESFNKNYIGGSTL